MKRAVLTLTVLISAGAVGLQAQGRDQFAGTWKLNTDKSEMGGGRGGGGQRGRGMGGGMMAELVVTASASELSVEAGERTTTYKLDGSEFTIPGPRGDARAKARVEGSQILIESTSTFEGPNGAMTITSKETWEIQDGSLVITTVYTTPRGDRTTKRVYDKQ